MQCHFITVCRKSVILNPVFFPFTSFLNGGNCVSNVLSLLTKVVSFVKSLSLHSYKRGRKKIKEPVILFIVLYIGGDCCKLVAEIVAPLLDRSF